MVGARRGKPQDSLTAELRVEMRTLISKIQVHARIQTITRMEKRLLSTEITSLKVFRLLGCCLGFSDNIAVTELSLNLDLQSYCLY